MQHGNEGACTACYVVGVKKHGPVKIERIYCVFLPDKSNHVPIQSNNRSV